MSGTKIGMVNVFSSEKSIFCDVESAFTPKAAFATVTLALSDSWKPSAFLTVALMVLFLMQVRVEGDADVAVSKI